jgi:uncharacterized protein (UPF0218 family)
MLSIIILLVLLCIPLVESFVAIGHDITTKQTIITSTTTYLETIDPRIRLVSSSYQGSQDEEQLLEIALQLHVPQSIIFTDNQRLELTQLLAQALDQSVSLQFVIIPTVAVQKITNSLPTPKESIDQMVKEYLDMEDMGITYIASTYLENEDVYILSLYAPSDEPIRIREREITSYLGVRDDAPTDIIIDRRQPQDLSTVTDQTAVEEMISNIRQDFMSYVGTSIVLDEVIGDDDLLTLTITSYATTDRTMAVLSGRYASIGETPPMDLQIQYKDKLHWK